MKHIIFAEPLHVFNSFGDQERGLCTHLFSKDLTGLGCCLCEKFPITIFSTLDFIDDDRRKHRKVNDSC